MMARRVIALLFAVLTAAWLQLAYASPALSYTQQEQQELQIGKEVYQQLERKGQIIRSSPYYDVLSPIGVRIAHVADKQYFVPFHFILVHDSQPNAFAVPGGYVYVTDTMMSFVQNKEELAGVLCHEVTHDIHHDVYDLYVKGQRISLWATIAQLLLGSLSHSQLTTFAIDFLANVQALRFSRDVEHNADLTGAYICAEAGIDPWGMVWMMRRFEQRPTSNPPEFLADHPTESHRIADLERLFAENPATFERFNPDVANATPLEHPGFRTQYRVGYSAEPRETAPPSIEATPRAQPSAKPSAKSTCPPGWKFCPKDSENRTHPPL